MTSTLWLGTRKGLFALRADARRRSWRLAGPQFLGHSIASPLHSHTAGAATVEGQGGTTATRRAISARACAAAIPCT